MKITSIATGQQAAARSVGNTETTGSASFRSFLEKELRAADAGRPAEETGPASSVAAAPAGLRLDSLSLSENTITTLEHFGAALANSSFRGNDLEPFASALEEESAALVDLKNHLPEGDPLAALLERVATVSYLEAAKFRRGDYNA
jgi:hypothetical protein